jgi:hypothetical protein
LDWRDVNIIGNSKESPTASLLPTVALGHRLFVLLMEAVKCLVNIAQVIPVLDDLAAVQTQTHRQVCHSLIDGTLVTKKIGIILRIIPCGRIGASDNRN